MKVMMVIGNMKDVMNKEFEHDEDPERSISYQNIESIALSTNRK
jgi:hypothetical protein